MMKSGAPGSHLVYEPGSFFFFCFCGFDSDLERVRHGNLEAEHFSQRESQQQALKRSPPAKTIY